MTLLRFFERILEIGLEPKELNFLHVALRVMLVFVTVLTSLNVAF